VWCGGGGGAPELIRGCQRVRPFLVWIRKYFSEGDIWNEQTYVGGGWKCLCVEKLRNLCFSFTIIGRIVGKDGLKI